MTPFRRVAACGVCMSVKDHRKGRTRIRCTVAIESLTCGNARAYYLEDIEAAVVGGQREAIALYVKAYNDERRRLAADSVNQCAQMENGWRRPRPPSNASIADS